MITDLREWLFYKKQYNVTTPSNINMFAVSNVKDNNLSNTSIVTTDENGLEITNIIGEPPRTVAEQEAERRRLQQSNNNQGLYIVLEAQETAFIPFKFQSLCCGAIDVRWT